MPIKVAKEKAQRRLEDAKKLLEAAEKRFGGNVATKNTQRNLLKQQYGNFTASSSEILDQTFDRLQKLVNQLELLGEKLSQEDVNQKLLRSLSPEWNTHVVVWRNKADLDTISMDDLYNNLKCEYDWSDQAEEETVKILKSHNEPLSKDLKKSELMVLGYKTGLKSVEERLEFYKTNESIYLEDIKVLKVKIQIKYIAIRELRKKLNTAQKEKDGIQLEVDKFVNASKTLYKLIDCQIVGNCKKGLGYESYNAVPPPYTGNFMPLEPDLSFTRFDEFVSEPVDENSKAKPSEEEPKVVRKNNDALIIKEWVSDNEEDDVNQPKIEKKIVRPSIVKKEFVNSKLQKKTVRKIVNQNTIFKLYETIWVSCYHFYAKDHLGKFNGKADEGFFVGYSLNIKAFRVFNSRTKIVEENLHIRFSENTPNVVGTKSNDNAGQARKESEHVDEDPRQKSECKDQEKETNVNSTNNVNAASITLVEIKTSKPKAKGIVLQEQSESITTTTTTISLKKSQDKGKAIIIEDHVKPNKKVQIMLNEETAKNLQAEFDKEQRIARKKAKKELVANIALIEEYFITELVEGSSKRVGEELTQESVKMQKLDDDKETAELKQLMKIIPDEEEVEIDAISLAVKSPNIID
uniref:Retroviral polymerase SH3-like domain-containing protein n=1 Tax=Tanacetum cinerariifolium TaxID=118510 RepID=A0A699H4C5_TANCI|nr:hypothetical protein [Tanacetum cinerariifolium]